MVFRGARRARNMSELRMADFFQKSIGFISILALKKKSSELAMAETLPFKIHSRDFFKRLQRPYFGSGTLLRSMSGRSLGYRLVSLEWQDFLL